MPPRTHNSTGAGLPRASAAGSLLWAPLLASMVFAFVMVLPTLIKGNASGHDFEFHLASWMEVDRQWHEGVVYPRWAPGAHFGFGEPRFIFYPPISWILGAALGNILPWPAVPGAFAWLALTIAGLSAYRLVREWQPPGAALWAAGLYATNPYNLINIYARSAFAELLASALFPLVLLCALRLVPPAVNEWAETRAPQRSVVPLVLAVAAIWLTNAPVGVITCYALALLLAIGAIRRRSLEPVLRGGLAGAMGLALCGFYVIPAFFEQKWVHIAEAFSSGLRPQDNFPFTWWINEDHRRFNFLVSWVQMAELALAALVFTSAWRSSGRTTSEEEREIPGKAAPAAGPSLRDAWLPIFCLGIGASVLLLRPSLPLWQHLPFLKEVQFPWRLLFVLNATVAFVAATAERPGRLRHAWKILTLALWLVLNSYLLTPSIWEGTDVAEFAAAVQSSAGYESVDEYVPGGADRDQLAPGAPQIALADSACPPDRLQFKVEKWQAEEKDLSIEASQPARLQLRLLNYPAWQVEVNGGPGVKESHPDTGQLIVSVPAGHNRLRVRFARTSDRSAGGALSLAAVALTVALFLAGKRQNPMQIFYRTRDRESLAGRHGLEP